MAIDGNQRPLILFVFKSTYATSYYYWSI